jgi:hypothetical protein
MDPARKVVQIREMSHQPELETGTTAQAAQQFTLALDLLSGSDAGAQLDRGIALVEAASAAGYGPASEFRAIFEAMGIQRPQNWPLAFDLLQLAAEQGSPSAQIQLLLLADNSREPVIPDTVSSGLWAQVRERISIDALLRHGERRALSDNPRIRVIESFASPAECRWMIERARSRLQPALIFDTTGRQAVDPRRSNTGADFQVHEMGLVLEVIRARISAATRIPLPVFELTQVLHYSVGQEFRRHHDFLDPVTPGHEEQIRSRGQRIATFLIYLNDEFEGGETDFPKVGIRYRGKAGDAIFWANVDMEGHPDPLTLHAGLSPTSGEKWILSQWIRDRAGSAQ